ncbi:hypothetical protein M885DRAFT_509636 [Pelagophyceae sp. CCMP2097]|nr:hypothetical protein M885DRAFT_509636 [Pelagophyceae sp. CCMP2097]|mmetsp:Transcript_10441/g.36197  ORF Transcript_10441/g.36197 Transcript_10441/m.36197 type:complete len:200 (+) Transcript_10441:351-950(+)
MLATLLGAGYDVTLSDADAVWFEDAQPFFDRANSHIVASRGSFPVHLARLWGTTACMGLVHFKSGDATSALVRRMVQRVVVHGDDQRALNEALFDVGVEWPSLMQYVGSSTDALGNATIDGDELRVALLPHDAFVRRCPQTFAFDKGVVVQHCYTAKSGRAKHTILETHGAWFLRNDWLDVYESDPGKWLRQVQRPLAA